MMRRSILTKILPLTLAAALLGPLAASAQTPAPTPPTPVAPAAPAAPTPAARNANRVNGKITDVDATAKTVTVSRGKKGKKTITLSVPDGTKIFKAGDTKKDPTGTFADLTVDSMITARTDGDPDKPVATQVHIQTPKTAAPAAPAAPTTPAPPAAP